MPMNRNRAMSMGRWMVRGVAVATAAVLVGCGGGGGSADDGAAGGTAGGSSGGNTAMGTLGLSLTDSPACGYEHLWVTVEKVRVHRNASAGDGDAGWVDIPLPQPANSPAVPLRVDLLTLTNGTLVPLGRVQLPAGSYNQMRLVLAENTGADPYANAIVPSGGAIVPLKTPSAQQSGLKMKVGMEVPAGQEADFAIDFDACRSIVRAGKKDKYLLKPVLSVIPILSPAGQRIQGWLDPSLADAGATVSLQSQGVVVRATPPALDGGGNLRFELYPVPVGSYELIVATPGHATAVVTGVPAYASMSTTVNSVDYPILPPPSGSQSVSGTVTYGGSGVDTGGQVRALQALSGGPTIEVASANAADDDGTYTMTLPLAASVTAPYVSGTAPLLFTPVPGPAGSYLLSATVSGSPEVKTQLVVLGANPVTQDFSFAAVP